MAYTVADALAAGKKVKKAVMDSSPIQGAKEVIDKATEKVVPIVKENVENAATMGELIAEGASKVAGKRKEFMHRYDKK